jgi:SAM-dependent methyltransferase
MDAPPAAATYLTAPSLGAYEGYDDALDYGVRGSPLAAAEAMAVMSRLRDMGAFGPGGSVLDMGCGVGFLLKEAMAISPSPSSPHFGLDKSQAMVLAAMRHLRPDAGGGSTATLPPKVRRVNIKDITQVQAVLTPTPPSSSSLSSRCYKFDLVVCCNVISHIDPRPTVG